MIFLASCSKETIHNTSDASGSSSEPSAEVTTDGLVEVSLSFDSEGNTIEGTGTIDTTKTKVVIVDGVGRRWEEGDAIGVFAGDDNVNVRFALTGGAGTKNAKFTGKLSPVTEAVTLYAYYPYSEGNTDPARIEPVYSPNQQVYNGDYAENGTFPNYGKYAYMGAYLTNFTVDDKGKASGTGLYSYSTTGLARFDLKSNMSSDLHIRSIHLNVDGYYMLCHYYLDLTAHTWSMYYEENISLDLNEGKNDYVTIPSGSTKYAQLVVSESRFSNSGTALNITAYGDDGSRNVKFSIPKTVKPANDFATNVRRKISLPLSDPEYSHSVAITQKGNSFVTPYFDFSSANYLSGDVFWGDGTSETFTGGSSHTFSDSGTHNITVNAWGTSAITFENLENIEAIDFSNL